MTDSHFIFLWRDANDNSIKVQLQPAISEQYDLLECFDADYGHSNAYSEKVEGHFDELKYWIDSPQRYS